MIFYFGPDLKHDKTNATFWLTLESSNHGWLVQSALCSRDESYGAVAVSWGSVCGSEEEPTLLYRSLGTPCAASLALACFRLGGWLL